MKNPANQISFLIQSSVALPPIRLTSLLFFTIVVVVVTEAYPGYTSNISQLAWKHPCSKGDPPVDLPPELANTTLPIVFTDVEGFTMLYTALNNLSREIAHLAMNYFRIRFPSDDMEIYLGIQSDIVPKFDSTWGYDVSNSTYINKDTIEDLVERSYETLASFSIFLYYATAVEEKLSLTIRFNKMFDNLHGNENYGVVHSLCTLTFFTQRYDLDDRLYEKLDKYIYEKIPKYIMANQFQMDLLNFFAFRRFRYNILYMTRAFHTKATNPP